MLRQSNQRVAFCNRPVCPRINTIGCAKRRFHAWVCVSFASSLALDGSTARHIYGSRVARQQGEAKAQAVSDSIWLLQLRQTTSVSRFDGSRLGSFCRRPIDRFAVELLQPFELKLYLRNYQRQHPNCFVIRMPTSASTSIKVACWLARCFCRNERLCRSCR